LRWQVQCEIDCSSCSSHACMRSASSSSIWSAGWGRDRAEVSYACTSIVRGGGVTLDDCGHVSGQVSSVLDVET
jgi:hypothetical protein